MLHPGLQRVWRGPDTVQFGVDVTEPLVLTGVDDSTAILLQWLDGSSSLDQLVERAVAAGHDRARTHATVATLLEAGVIVDATRWPGGQALTPTARRRLAPDLLARALNPVDPQTALGDADAHAAQLAAVGVRVHGGSRLGSVVAALLVAAGVGRVDLIDDRPIEAADLAVAGHHPLDLGMPRTALTDRLEPWRASSTQPARYCLDVVTDAMDSRVLTATLAQECRPHLVVSAHESIGRIGPLVLPGQSACLRCYDLTRTDQDPGWPHVALQRDSGRPPASACDGLLVHATASLAALHIVDHLGGRRPPSVNGVVELVRPHATMTTEGLTPHPACGCRWQASPQDERMVS